MRVAVIGGGGFIGSNLVSALPDVKIIEWGEPLDFSGCDAVVHLAANADVRRGWENPRRDIDANYLLTADVLETMRKQGVRKLIFPSTGSVYAPKTTAIKETDELRATSLYAASKIAAEQLIAAYAAAGHVDATIFRLVSVLGPHYTHGLIFDFMKKLANDPPYIEVLRPGTSRKSYVHVADVVSAMLTALEWDEKFGIYNVGTDETMTPFEIASIITDKPIKLVGETWVGDNQHILLDNSKLRAEGWWPEYTIREAVQDTAKSLMAEMVAA